jgi:RNA polymerase sigma factor (TIGR02999 family)
MASDADSLTRMLNATAAGDARAASELLPLIYDELRAMARANLRGAQGASFQPTALVHEAYIRLFGAVPTDWNSRGHFFSAAARTMRHILVDQARRRASLKRGGGGRRLDVDAVELTIEAPSEDVLALDEALTQLEHTDPRKVQLISLHCFGGLTLEETAAALGISLSTAEREWRFARALLNRQLSSPESQRKVTGSDGGLRTDS